ncbi:MAG: multicopper oxidase domain-containing protein [Sneathiella sp.]
MKNHPGIPYAQIDTDTVDLHTGMSRRTLLSGVSGAVIASLASRLASGAETTSKSALQGELLEAANQDYELVAQFANYPLQLEYGVDKDGKPDHASPNLTTGHFHYLCRSWGLDGVFDGNFLGPVLELKPGKPFSIKIVNNLKEEGIFEGIGPEEPKAEDWLPLIDPDNVAYSFLHKVDPLGMPFANRCKSSSPISDIAVDEVNVPKNYNWTNLHLHGLQITPHLFEPEGTLEKTSDYITIKPGEEKTYTFSLPEDHPCGTFWYHPHRHNSVAIQSWSGMAGMVLVRGKYDEEIKSYGITTEIPFAVHDPHYTVINAPDAGSPGTAKVARFLANQNGEDDYSFLVTGRYRPEFTVKRNEVVLIRHLSATIENVNAFRVVKSAQSDKPVPPDTDDDNIPFHIIASDGIAYDRPVKRMSMVCGGGERHDMLIQFPESGLYEVWSDHCGTIQFYGGGPKDQLLATFRVTDEAAVGQAPISEMTFTPGISPKQDISQEEIVYRRHVVFDLSGNT